MQLAAQRKEYFIMRHLVLECRANINEAVSVIVKVLVQSPKQCIVIVIYADRDYEVHVVEMQRINVT